MTQATMTMQLQPSALCFAVPLQLAAADPAANERRFSGVAYGGGVITDHAAWDAIGFDLTGITARAPMSLLLQHDSERVIGVIDQVNNDGAQLTIGGRLFTGIDADAAMVAAKADAGTPWQMSVGIFPEPGQTERVLPGAAYSFNGRTHTGPAHVFRKSRVREVSFVALGADHTTRASVFNKNAGPITLTTFTTGAPNMANPDTAALDAVTAAAAAEKTRADTAEAALAALQAQFAARERTERETAVKALLGDEFSAEKAAPYLDMTPVQFTAVQTAMGALRSRLPEGFTAEQATKGRAAGSGGLTPEAIVKYRADNPGASYEKAFSVLTGQGASATPLHF